MDKNKLHEVMEDDGQVPDLKHLTENLVKILAEINSEEMIQLFDTDKELFKEKMEQKFPEFSNRYYSLFQQLLEKDMDNIGKLIMMLTNLHKVEHGELTMDDAFNNVRESLSEDYIYPKFGGKENFEKTMRERGKKKQI